MENTNQQPPSYGSRSYAELIKQRLIYGRFYAGWSVTQGRYNFQVMYGTTDTGWRAQPLGYEMTLSYNERGRRPPNEDNDWAIRVYFDGTALYRPHKLGYLRHPTISAITAVMTYFFYLEAQIQEADRYNHTRVLRRKPINPHHLAPVSTDFGEFLTGKYNGGRQ